MTTGTIRTGTIRTGTIRAATIKTGTAGIKQVTRENLPRKK
jgi:hypothetical protein